MSAPSIDTAIRHIEKGNKERQKETWTHADYELADTMAELAYDPYKFVMFAFEWGKGQLQYRKPEPWQKQFLEDIGEQVRANDFDGKNAVEAIQMAISSGHGIGKSAMTSWLILWIMSTRPHSKGTVTANTMTQLKTKTWAELRKWHKLCITGYWFDITATSMTNKQNPETWRCDIQSSKEENSEAFAGQHAIMGTSFYIFDEASRVPNKIWEVAKGGLTDGEPMFFTFGNPTRSTGAFKDCFGEHRHRWDTRKIDSRTVSFTNKKEIQKWIDDYGHDHDFVRVRVLGEFPRASSLQFIDTETIDKAVERELRKDQYQYAPVVLGVDVAWEGDDQHVIVLRQGLYASILGKWRHLPHETATLTQLVAQFEDLYNVDATFVDQHGVGAGVIDGLRQLKRYPIPVNSNAKPKQPDQFGSKRTELWWDMRQWLYDGGSIPKDKELIRDLTAPEYLPVNDGKVFLEPKSVMKKRGIESPDVGDALAYTFYAAVAHRPLDVGGTYIDRDAYYSNPVPEHQAAVEYDVLNYR